MVWNCDASRLGGCRVQMSSSIIGCDGDVKCSHLLQHTAVRVAHTHTQKTSRSMKTTLTLAGRMSSHISLLCFFLYFLVSFHRGILLRRKRGNWIDSWPLSPHSRIPACALSCIAAWLEIARSIESSHFEQLKMAYGSENCVSWELKKPRHATWSRFPKGNCWVSARRMPIFCLFSLFLNFSFSSFFFLKFYKEEKFIVFWGTKRKREF